MNLFVESINKYVTSQCDTTLENPNAGKEVRIFIQSLPPLIAQQIFLFLEEYYYSDTLERHLKIAKGLWTEWEGKYPGFHNQLSQIESKGWVDLDDKLTFYRNLSCPPAKRGLIVIIIGLDHATDKGGLSDFHVVREDTIWNQELQCSYREWIEQLINLAGLTNTASGVSALEKFFIALFQHRHRSLVDLSDFIQNELYPSVSSMNTASELAALAYEKLPFWRIPPLLDIPNYERQGQALLGDAATFISHQSFQTPSDRKKAKVKIAKAVNDGLFSDVPATPGHTGVYASPADFISTVISFIDNDDMGARNKLLATDLTKLLQILKKKTGPREPGVDKPLKYKGPVLVGILQAIWEALEDFKKECGDVWAPTLLNNIDITILTFKHNVRDDDSDDTTNEIAEKMLIGIIGGLDKYLGNLTINLRDNADDIHSTHHVPVNFSADQLADVHYTATRTQPLLEFRIKIKTAFEQRDKSKDLHCIIDDNSEERVRYQYAKKVLGVLKRGLAPIVPLFTMQRTFTELFFSCDSDDANRLVREGLSDLEVVDAFQGVNANNIDPQLRDGVALLAKTYRSYLNKMVEDGPYTADDEDLGYLIDAYHEITKKILLSEMVGRQEVLARIYKAFFIIPKTLSLSEGYLNSAIAIGITPAVAELVQARNRFLVNSFPEAVVELLEKSVDKGTVAFERLLGLVEIRRPIAALVQDVNRVLTTSIKSFGMIHCIGATPNSELSLASQSIMRVEEIDDENAVKELIKPNEESKIIHRVLSDYQRLHPYSHDQLRILVANVDELQSVIAGVHKFLEEYLKEQPNNAPVLQLYLKIYSKSTSPGAIANQLTAWRDLWLQKELSTRPVRIRIGHRYAPAKEKMCEYLRSEEIQYDIGFLMHFMDSDQGGDDVEPVAPFEFNFAASNISKFPISEYPRPIRVNDASRRQTLLSNRRMRLQTCHTELSARLKHPFDGHNHYLVFGMVDYTGWKNVVNEMHRNAQWVVCVDPYVDKRLLEGTCAQGSDRKIVGFAAGLGCYGELNMTVSTEADTLARLTALIRNQFKRLFPNWDGTTCEQAALTVLEESQEITGLSLIRAVGDSEYIRDVVAYAAIRKVLKPDPTAIISQLIPMDSVKHWFSGADENLRPDLLHLVVHLDGTLLRIHATLIECKLGQENETHVAKAVDQIKAGLRRMTYLFMPNGNTENIMKFDRRYWWAQLQRTIASRAQVNMNEVDYRRLNVAFEHLSEGYYAIDWDAMVVTLWTDRDNVAPAPNLTVSIGPMLHIPNAQETISVRHAEFGRDVVATIFTTPQHPILGIDNKLFRCNYVADEEVDFGAEEEIIQSTSPEKIAEGLPSEKPLPFLQQPESLSPVSAAVELVPTPIVPVPPISSPAEAPQMKPDVPIYSVPDRILIGTDRNGQPHFWEYGHNDLQNRHLLIFGASGSGKTYAIQSLLAELSKHRQNSLIVDYTDGYLPNHLEAVFKDQANPRTHLVKKDPLPINPFQFQTQVIEGFDPIRESPFNVASRIASVFTSVYSTIGEQQVAELINTIQDGLEANANYDLDGLLTDLNERSDVARTLANKITPFIKMRPFANSQTNSWKTIFNHHEGMVHILQLASVSRDIQQLITEFALWDLYDYASSHGNKNIPLPIVLDEVQTLDHRKDSPLEKFLREGRKFGISLILATQTLSNFETQERDRLFQAAHKLFFAPADTEIKRFADILKDNFPTGTKDEWTQRLSKLQKGECLSIGPAMSADGKLVNRVVQLKITSMDERFNGKG
jgi:DNA phosphorothioation-dependent restriction protein DptH